MGVGRTSAGGCGDHSLCCLYGGSRNVRRMRLALRPRVRACTEPSEQKRSRRIFKGFSHCSAYRSLNKQPPLPISLAGSGSLKYPRGLNPSNSITRREMVWAAEGQLFRKTAVTASGEPPRLLPSAGSL